MRSEAQRRYLHANEPEVAERFEAETPKGAKLPERVRKTEGLTPEEFAPEGPAPEGLAPPISYAPIPTAALEALGLVPIDFDF